MRTHMPVSVSLPPDLFAAAERRAAQLGFKRATYIQQLILADLRRQKTDPASGGWPLAVPAVSPKAGAAKTGSRSSAAASGSKAAAKKSKAIKEPKKAAGKKKPARKR